MTITARWNGPGDLHDPDPQTKTDELVPAGETFETTITRLGQLEEQGLDVVNAGALKPSVTNEPARAEENA